MTSLYLAPASRRYACRMASKLTSGIPHMAASTARRRMVRRARSSDEKLCAAVDNWVAVDIGVSLGLRSTRTEVEEVAAQHRVERRERHVGAGRDHDTRLEVEPQPVVVQRVES